MRNLAYKIDTEILIDHRFNICQNCKKTETLTCNFLIILSESVKVNSLNESLQFSALDFKDFDKLEKVTWIMRSLNAWQMRSLAWGPKG